MKFMMTKVNKGILQRLTARISTGLFFIESNCFKPNSTPDAAWIRNIYILLSFYTELLLKAVYVYEKNVSSRNQLDKLLRGHSHNLASIASDMGPNVLKKYQIFDIKIFKKHQYRIKTDMGTFDVKDFRDIRYDFLVSRIRKLKGNEHAMFEIQIAVLNRINSSLKNAL